ncbi:hypothetical protein [Morganella morganii]|uniref:hypothetical protein n=1 Tax=Morganella morganii TaxID=582 RepID=UPI00114767ED|nr:hypothetical protein [Morganella morganii]
MNYSVSGTNSIALVILFYIPILIFVYALYKGIKVVNEIKMDGYLTLPLIHNMKMISFSMIILGLILPICRFVIPLIALKDSQYQIIIYIGDIVLVLMGLLLRAVFISLTIGRLANQENKEFV